MPIPASVTPLVEPERADLPGAGHAPLPAPEPPRAQLHVVQAAPARRFYLRVRTRFLISVTLALSWAIVSTMISLPWIRDLSAIIGSVPAVFVVAGIAIIPGYLNVQLVTSILLDRPAPLDLRRRRWPKVAILVAAYNEAGSISETITYALASDYPGKFEVVVVDDGSTDGTPETVELWARKDPRVRLVRAEHGGKALALNAALVTVNASLVATIDADTLLMPSSLRRIVARLLQSPPDTVAVAGSVLARNSRRNFLTRMQEWDYFLAISSVKRQQALLQGTLVAQGAFSVYRTAALRDVGGWPDRIGEDIVLTWAMIGGGGRTGFEPSAIAFTEVPERFRHFVRQRERWARGMIEGLRDHGPELLGKGKLYGHSIAVNYLFPYLDGIYTICFLPGVILACTGNFLIVGPMTVAVLPINILIASIMLHRQRQVFREAGFRIRRNYAGFLAYLLLYAPVMSPVSFVGYVKELAGVARRWK